MQPTITDWHNRFQIQANWTKAIRDHILKKISISQTSKILEIGCGTGVILKDISHLGYQYLYGLDLDFSAVKFAFQVHYQGFFVNGNAFQLPFKTAIYDVTFCHYFLLWILDPLKAINEMIRITKPGGFIIAFAEPDYLSRIIFPNELKQFTDLQTKSLETQGVDISMGRKLKSIFHEAGLFEINAGIIGAEWQHEPDFVASEINTLMLDIKFIETEFDLTRLESLMQVKGIVNFVPTFYAYGRVNPV